MTRDDIIRMAREAGLERNGYWEFDKNRLERFFLLAAAAGAAAEREACARVCDEYAKNSSNPMNFAENCAAAIRARGES